MNRQTKQRKVVFLDTLEKTRGIVTAVCEKTGVSRSTYYNWFAKDKRFAAKVNEILRSRIEVLEDRVFTAGMSGDIRAATFMLKHLHPDFKAKPRNTNEVHIYHHVDKQSGDTPTPTTITQMIWEEGRRRYNLAHTAPVQADEEES